MDNSIIGKHKFELDTPCLVIDKTKLIDNIKLMQEFSQAKKLKVNK